MASGPPVCRQDHRCHAGLGVNASSSLGHLAVLQNIAGAHIGCAALSIFGHTHLPLYHVTHALHKHMLQDDTAGVFS